MARHRLRLALLLLEGGEVLLPQLLELVRQGTTGSRRASATSFRAAGQILARRSRCGREPRRGRRETESRAFSLSSSSSICWRVCFAVPRMSMSTARSADGRLPFRSPRSPKWSDEGGHDGARRGSSSAGARASGRRAASPRACAPRCCAGDGSNSSPAAIACVALVALEERGDVGRVRDLGAVRLRRSGMNSPTVRFEALRYARRDALHVLGRHLARCGRG